MEQSEYPDFFPAKILDIDEQAGKEWKEAGVVFCENNGWDWEGNAYLLDIDVWGDNQIADLENELKERNINLYDFSKEVSGYNTSLFGFKEDEENQLYEFREMETENLEICEEIMADLGIRWNGWSEAPSFTIVASEEQLQELIKRLEKPLEEWKFKNKNRPLRYEANIETFNKWK